jgi:hypothetical protein
MRQGLILVLLLPVRYWPIGHLEACEGYVARLVLTDHALCEAFDLVF